MHTRRGKLVTVLCGTSVAVLLILVAGYWKDLYCHLFLDPRLVGRWEGAVPGYAPSRHVIEFDRTGNVAVVSTGHPGISGADVRFVRDVAGTYRIDEGSLSIVWADGGKPPTGRYEIADDSLSLWWASGFFIEYRRDRTDGEEQ